MPRTSAMESRLVVASNRGPITYGRDHRGRLVPSRGVGGLVTALSGVFFHDDSTWVSAAFSDEDLEIARTGRSVGAGPSQHVRFVDIPPDRFDLHYNEFSNRVLWFLHHYLWDIPRTPVFGDDTREAFAAYVEANRAFAKELAKEASKDPVYLIQDYHLDLVPRMLRELAPEARILHFSHTPFAGTHYLRILPTDMREEILRGMVGADIVGFQSRGWAENFLLSLRSVPGIRVDLRSGRFSQSGREGVIRVFPVAVNPHALRAAREDPEAVEYRSEVEDLRRDGALLLRVDRLEPSKNILRGFMAYDRFLQQNRGWRGKVRFLALLSPSRDKLPEYQVYADECLGEAMRINEEFGSDRWTPIEVRVQESFLYAVAAYSQYDALVVNPLNDGMNLVAMEGPLVNERFGALVLSRNAGAYERIGRYAIGVNPFDVQETADAIRTALEMPHDERHRRARGLTRGVLAHTPERWLAAQLQALDAIRRPDTSEGAEKGEQSGGSFYDEISGGL